MKKSFFKLVSLVVVATMLFSIAGVSTFASSVDYKITNPYESVMAYIGNEDNHYKTNLHTHSTYSDANVDLASMVKEHYNQDFHVLGFADHGVIGVEWDQTPTLLPLYYYNYVIMKEQAHLTTEESEAIQNGTYKTALTYRTTDRGMKCVTGAIEGNYLVTQKNHVNGYFMNDSRAEGVMGKEGDFETMVRLIEEAGGISHINHPGDWLSSAGDESIARDPGNVEFFADILLRYPSCLGIEVYNAFDRPTSSDRILWDELLQVCIPQGKNVWGFGNNDAHHLNDIDTAFMDFVMPEFSQENVRTTMENGAFFAVSRYEDGERIGDETVSEYPMVTCILVDEDADTITIVGKNCDKINWIADGEIIQTNTKKSGDVVSSTIKLRAHSDEIGSYVRAELEGAGGKTLTQAFVCDDGDMTDDNYTDTTVDAVATVTKDFIAMLLDFIKTILFIA